MTRVSATITGKGQVTIPIEIRKHLGVSSSDKIEFFVDRDGKVRVERVKYTFEDLCGILPPLPGASPDLTKEISEATEEGIDRRLSRWGREE